MNYITKFKIAGTLLDIDDAYYVIMDYIKFCKNIIDNVHIEYDMNINNYDDATCTIFVDTDRELNSKELKKVSETLYNNLLNYDENRLSFHISELEGTGRSIYVNDEDFQDELQEPHLRIEHSAKDFGYDYNLQLNKRN